MCWNPMEIFNRHSYDDKYLKIDTNSNDRIEIIRPLLSHNDTNDMVYCLERSDFDLES